MSLFILLSLCLLFCFAFVIVFVIVNVVIVVVNFVIVIVYQVEQDFGVVGRDGQGPPETLDRLLGVAFHPPEVSNLKESEKVFFFFPLFVSHKA